MSEERTAEKILTVAKQEFLEKGFMEASMRSIASKLGITATALYRHYRDKEAIFDALVAPAFQVDGKEYAGRREELLTTMTQDSTDAMWSQETGRFSLLVDHVYAHYDAYKLILCCSAGTKYENYIHDLAQQMQNDTFYFMEVARKAGASVKEVDPVEFHLLVSAQYSAFFEIVHHDFSYEKAKHYANVLEDFFQPSWRKLLGF